MHEFCPISCQWVRTHGFPSRFLFIGLEHTNPPQTDSLTVGQRPPLSNAFSNRSNTLLFARAVSPVYLRFRAVEHVPRRVCTPSQFVRAVSGDTTRKHGNVPRGLSDRTSTALPLYGHHPSLPSTERCTARALAYGDR